MKKLILAIAIAAIFAMGSMVYAGQFGPPEPAAKEGKAAFGVGYFYYSAKWKPKSTIEGWTTSKVNVNQAYLQLGYGFTKNWEAYLRVGGADLKVKDVITDPDITNTGPKDFKDGLKPFGTIGVRGVFNITPSFGIGPFFQASLYSSYKDGWTLNELGWSDQGWIKEKVKKPREINLGLGLQGKIGEAVLYGGPFAYWCKIKMEGVVQNLTTGESETGSTTFKEKGNIGGFAGVRIPLSKSLNLEVEGQLKSRFSMGGALTYAF